MFLCSLSSCEHVSQPVTCCQCLTATSRADWRGRGESTLTNKKTSERWKKIHEMLNESQQRWHFTSVTRSVSWHTQSCYQDESEHTKWLHIGSFWLLVLQHLVSFALFSNVFIPSLPFCFIFLFPVSLLSAHLHPSRLSQAFIWFPLHDHCGKLVYVCVISSCFLSVINLCLLFALFSLFLQTCNLLPLLLFLLNVSSFLFSLLFFNSIFCLNPVLFLVFFISLFAQWWKRSNKITFEFVKKNLWFASVLKKMIVNEFSLSVHFKKYISVKVVF